uniref:C-type lectin domain-containing protein n=1 Tax=Dicentrarchus labrax TaxID=13489 RepID=A0A8C4E1I4_DICLA
RTSSEETYSSKFVRLFKSLLCLLVIKCIRVCIYINNHDSINTKYVLYHQPSGYGFNSCSQFPKRKYYYVNMPMNWTEAQHYCREKYTDLATIESTDDISRLKPDFLYAWAWIGLKDDPKSWKVSMGNDTNSWRWSATGLTSKTGYHNWKVGQPNNEWSNANCVSMGTNGKWYDRDCKSLWSFVCYNGKKNT